MYSCGLAYRGTLDKMTTKAPLKKFYFLIVEGGVMDMRKDGLIASKQSSTMILG